MNKKNDLLKNTIILFVGKFCTQFLSFFLLPIYTLFLSTDDYGIFDLISNYVILLSPLLTFEIEAAVFRFLIDERKENRRKDSIIFSSYLVSFVAAAFSFLVIIILANFTNFDYAWHFYILLFFSIFNSINLQIARGNGNNKNYSLSCIIMALSNLILSFAFLFIFRLGLIGVIFSSIFANFFGSLFLFFSEKIYLSIKIKYFNKQIMKELLKYSFPLIPNAVIWWIINVSDRTIITIFLGVAQSGIYAISNKFSSVINSLYNIFNLSWTETVTLYIDSDEDGFISDVFNRALKFVSSASVLLISSLFFIFSILIKGNYNDAYYYVPILVISSIFNLIVANLGSIYIAKKMTKEVAKTSFASGFLNLFINLILINKLGLWASALSTLLSFFIMSIYRMIDVKKYVNMNYDFNFIFKFSVVLVINLILFYVNTLICNILNLIFSLLFFVLVNKDVFLSFALKIKK